MWNRLALKIKITILTTVTLTAMCACLTVISIANSDVFYEPVAYVRDKKPLDSSAGENAGAPQQIGEVENVDNINVIYLDSQDKFKTQSVIFAIIVVVFGTVISYFVAGHTLRPLHILADKIEKIDESNLRVQIVPAQSNDEVARLTNSFNSMLEKLEQAFENKKLFASNAAHELKTPLANILTNIEVLQMDEKPDINDYDEVIGITKENVERLNVLVQDLLHFNSDIDDGLCENIRTGSLFDKILSDLSDYINEKNLVVSRNGSANIYGDNTLLERAFFNLIQNAVKYNKDGGEIKIVVEDDIIVIEDSGIGIPEEHMPQIFEPFYCVDKSRSRKLGGSGLGLSIAKQIFEKHGMTITVVSELNKGTKIYIKHFKP